MVSIKMFVRIIIRFPLLLSVLCVCFLERRYDRDALPEEYLQHRIDDALAQWRSSPFARELDFAGSPDRPPRDAGAGLRQRPGGGPADFAQPHEREGRKDLYV